jgi:tetratricopeptide (TPR) repeat protein/tRNA A-37 threonylcarbamoyl transferase component Bud32
MIGNTLVGRYQIINRLGGGGFGETYVASDTHLPGSPQCVVKKLKPQSNNEKTLEIARRLFDTEAQVLYKLGTHDCIPQLLAYFEEKAEFYLVQEFIPSHDLSQELSPGKIFTQAEVISLLLEILEILDFVHQQKVIHRDVNPRNILRRKQDNKLILIDFGAVKEITTQVITTQSQTLATVAIGTPGYIPGEQAQGTPKFSSDIYALGIIAIQAVTGLSPQQLAKDSDTNEIIWREKATVTPEFANFLDQMIAYDFRQRYASATVALKVLQDLNKPQTGTLVISPHLLPDPIQTQSKPKSNQILNSTLNKKSLIWHKLALGVFCLGIVGTGALYIFNQVNTSNAIELYNQGNIFLQLNRYQDALGVYQEAVNLKPSYVEGWYGKGKALFELEKYQEAMIAYDKAIQIQPDYLPAWIGRGFVLLELEQYSQAISAFDQALKQEENYPSVWNAKGDSFRHLKQYDNAIRSYEKAIELQPENYESWYKKGLCLQTIQEYEEAVNAYQQVLELKPDYTAAAYNLGNSLVNLNRLPNALKAYSQAVQYQPNHYKAWFSRGNILVTLRRYSEAAESFQQVIKYNSRNYEAWYSLGWSLHQSKRYVEAIDAYKKAISLREKDHRAWYNLGNSQYILKKYEDALAAYNKAVAYKSNHHESWYSRGNVLLKLERYQEAVESYDQAIKYKPDYRAAIKAREQAQKQIERKKFGGIVVPTIRLPI